MSASEAIWEEWITHLRHRGMAGMVAFLMEALSPLSVAGAQLILVGEPVLSGFVPGARMAAFNELLDNHENYSHFILSLKKGRDL
jgi:hypothetical protein